MSFPPIHLGSSSGPHALECVGAILKLGLSSKASTLWGPLVHVMTTKPSTLIGIFSQTSASILLYRKSGLSCFSRVGSLHHYPQWNEWSLSLVLQCLSLSRAWPSKSPQCQFWHYKHRRGWHVITAVYPKPRDLWIRVTSEIWAARGVQWAPMEEHSPQVGQCLCVGPWGKAAPSCWPLRQQEL